MSKLAITGSSGMIGSHLKALFIKKDIEFVDINRSIWDLSKWKTDLELDNIFKNVKAIFHFAAALPTKYDNENQLLFDVNVRSCLNIAQWATKKDIPIIYLSSSSVYKNPHSNNIKEDNEKVIFGLGGFYGYSKLLAENIFNHFVPQGLKIIILRPTSVYGVGLKENNLISVFLNKASVNDTILIPEANNKINFIHAIDVAYAALIAYERFAYDTFNIAKNEMISIYDLVNILIKTVGSGKIGEIGDNVNSFERFDLDCTYAKERFNFNPKVNIQDGINAMYSGNMLESLYS